MSDKPTLKKFRKDVGLTDQEPADIGRPPLEKGRKGIKTSIVLSQSLWEDIGPKLELHGDLSKYVRYLIKRDLGKD
jgi:hypothetical protein